jgi:hypothetical protein
MKICVLVRVYNRIRDLQVCLEVVRRGWTLHDYHIVVISNGGEGVFAVPEACERLADRVVHVGTNPGHVSGNSQLLTAGLRNIPEDCSYAVLLEADTWVFSDVVVDGYIRRMEQTGAVWASAEWVERYHSIAVDFAVCQSRFLKAHPEIFEFTRHAETSVCYRLRSLGAKHLLVKEFMPIHVPKLLSPFYNPFQGRRRSFPRVPAVTHHLEDLKGGLEEKMELANYAAGRLEFPVPTPGNLRTENLKLRLLEKLLKWAPRSRWFRAKKSRPPEEVKQA